MIYTVQSLHLTGLNATAIEIEVDVSPGMPQFIIVGLPDATVSEARDRIRAAIKNSGLEFPRTKITVNLAPAHTKKFGSLFDLPMAIGIVAASGIIEKIPNVIMIGELALDGRVRPIQGALPLALHATAASRQVVLPLDNSLEVSLIADDRIHLVASLAELVEFCQGITVLPHPTPYSTAKNSHTNKSSYKDTAIDIADIIGQTTAKRALEIAAAGGHNVLLIGPPGVGKSMLAHALASLLPPMTQSEVVEATMVHSIISHKPTDIIADHPVRTPHHTATTAAIIGGGNVVRPGELSLAHKGILFFDELPEFRREVLEALRQPLESGTVTINRANGSVTYPAECIYIAACNPCPCGYAAINSTGSGGVVCHCSRAQIDRYLKKLSGPLLDRIDIKIHVTMIQPHELEMMRERLPAGETSAQVRQRTMAARTRQIQRQGRVNARLGNKRLQAMMRLEPDTQHLLRNLIEHHHLSLRGINKTIKVARTIADLAEHEQITTADIAEAVQYTTLRLEI